MQKKQEFGAEFGAVVWWKRLVHLLVDGGVVAWVGFQIMATLIAQFSYDRDYAWLQLAFIVLALWGFSYFFFLEFFGGGRTLGKFLTGSRVVSISGESPTAWQIVRRTFVRSVPYDPLTFLAAHPGGWHDRLSETRVVSVQQKEREGQSLAFPPAWKGVKILRAVIVVACLMGNLVFLLGPVVLFHDWGTTRELSPNQYEWSTFFLGEDVVLSGPTSVREASHSRDSRVLWEIPVAFGQAVTVEHYEGVGPEELLRQEIQELELHALLSPRLAEFEWDEEQTILWYAYELPEVPVSGHGFFIVTPSDGLYQIGFVGFKVDASAVLRRMRDDYSTSLQSTEL